jgi:hypothetical protein
VTLEIQEELSPVLKAAQSVPLSPQGASGLSEGSGWACPMTHCQQHPRLPLQERKLGRRGSAWGTQPLLDESGIEPGPPRSQAN